MLISMILGTTIVAYRVNIVYFVVFLIELVVLVVNSGWTLF